MRWFTATCIAAAIALPTAASGDTLVISADKDATIYSENSNANGAGPQLFVGDAGAAERRALVQFDLSAVPSGATVTSATITLSYLGGEDNNPGLIDGVISVHGLTKQWSEGPSDGTVGGTGMGGAGSPPLPGDVNYPCAVAGIMPGLCNSAWSTPGGDFGPSLATTTITALSNPGPVLWSSLALVAQVEAWLVAPATNAGVILIDYVPEGVKVFESSDGQPGFQPTLTLEYTLGGCAADINCNDGDACTDETCTLGQCVASQIDCSDGNACTTDQCDSGFGCFYIPTAAGGDCDDDLHCTIHDKCKGAGICQGTAKDCTDNEPCTKDGCDALDGGCVHDPQSGACDDGDSCTAGDNCSSGTCTGAPLVCDDNNPCTDDFCAGNGSCQATPNTGQCDDGKACTGTDQCKGGSCVGGAPIVCDDGNTCTEDTCDDTVGCVATPNSISCDDKLNCTFNDTCMTGDCIGEAVTCDDNEPCTKDGCDAGDGKCVHAPVFDACDDGSKCTLNETCATGKCLGEALNCDDGKGCTADSCDPQSGCKNVNIPADLPCSDDNACTAGDACDGKGGCLGAVIDCNDNNACTADSCDTGTGCVHTNVASGTPCLDGDVCDGAESCLDGQCTAGTPLDCNDDNGCTTDACDATNGCSNTDNTAPCGDGNVCNGAEMCAGGSCQSGAALGCTDDNDCTEDDCDPSLGCTFTDKADDEPCDDEDACTETDVCKGGDCEAGDPLDCGDGNPCHVATCDADTGCAQTLLDGTGCSDGDACNGAEQCVTGDCAAGTALDCNDGNPCTTDSCDATAGCVNAAVADDADCGDGDACNGAELCASGVCVAGTALDCGDGDVCTSDVCDASTGCDNAVLADGADCGDGDECNGDETCQVGVCEAGTPMDCNDDDACTTDSCTPGSGCTHEDIDDCCNEDDDCADSGVCMSVFCSDSFECDAEAIPDCCLTDDECDDGSAGTEDSCDLTTNTCVNTPLGCLAAADPAAECDDGVACTADVCGNDGQCVNNAIANCCEVDTDCSGEQTCDVDEKQCKEPTTTQDGGESEPTLDWGPDCTAAAGSSGSLPSGTWFVLAACVGFFFVRRRRHIVRGTTGTEGVLS